jgi:hypothetical protein
MLHEYHVVYSFRYYSRFHVTVVCNRGRSWNVLPMDTGTLLYWNPSTRYNFRTVIFLSTFNNLLWPNLGENHVDNSKKYAQEL